MGTPLENKNKRKFNNLLYYSFILIWNKILEYYYKLCMQSSLNIHKFIGIFFIFGYLLQITAASSLCPKGWRYSNLRCYKVEVYKDTWFDRSWSSARDTCMDEGGDLVTYNSALEAYSIHKHLKLAGITDKNLYWIGLNDDNNDGVYTWVDQSPLTYTNWYNGARPTWLTTLSNTKQPHQVVASGAGDWYDVTDHWRARIGDCNEPSGFVCEKRANLAIYSTILDVHEKPKLNEHQKRRERLKLVLGPKGFRRHPILHYGKSTVPSLVYDDYAHGSGFGANSFHHAINHNLHKNNKLYNMVKTWGPWFKPQYGTNYVTGKPSTTTVVYNFTAGGEGTTLGFTNPTTTAVESTTLTTTPLTTTTTQPETTTETTTESVRSIQPRSTSVSEFTTTAPPATSQQTTTLMDAATTTQPPAVRMAKTQPTKAVVIDASSTVMATTDNNVPHSSNAPYEYHSTTAADSRLTGQESTTAYSQNIVNKNQQYNRNNQYTTTLPPLDKVYHKGYHVHPFGIKDPVLPEANHGLPWKPVKHYSDRSIKQQGLHAAWMANVAMEPSYNFVNVTVFCQTAGDGIHPHPLHCWQFIVCGDMFGGNKEGFCYPGRAYHKIYMGCIEDKTCIYGARLVGVKKHIQANG